MDPVADVFAVAIDRHWLMAQQIADEKRYQLLGELVGAVVVGAARDYRGQVERVGVTADKQVRGGLARGIGTVRSQRRLLGEVPRLAETPINLIGGNMNKSLHLELAGGVEQDLCAKDVGADKRARIVDAAIDVAFRGEMEDRADPRANGGPHGVALGD